MKIAAIIPARYQSTRFPGKPLALIGGVPMIQRVYRQVEKCSLFHRVTVATDDRRIFEAVESFGGHAVMTADHHTSGTERLWEVLETTHKDADAAVNIQGDEPLIPVDLLNEACRELSSGTYDVVTPFYKNFSYEDFLSRHVVKVVMSTSRRALYFSRSPIPFTEREGFTYFNQHVGLYGYKRTAVKAFIELPGSRLEQSEKLEQLRFLDNNISIRMVESPSPSYGVDVPGDIKKIEAMLHNT